MTDHTGPHTIPTEKITVPPDLTPEQIAALGPLYAAYNAEVDRAEHQEQIRIWLAAEKANTPSKPARGRKTVTHD